MSQSRNQKDIKKLVARTENGEYVFCDYIFRDELHGRPFNGATGAIMCPVSREEYEERTSQEGLEEYLEEIWRQSVAAGDTQESLEEWARQAFAMDGDDLLWDQSYTNDYAPQLRAIGLTEEDYPVIECIGGGRIFHVTDKYAEVYDTALLAEILEVEGSNA